MSGLHVSRILRKRVQSICISVSPRLPWILSGEFRNVKKRLKLYISNAYIPEVFASGYQRVAIFPTGRVITVFDASNKGEC